MIRAAIIIVSMGLFLYFAVWSTGKVDLTAGHTASTSGTSCISGSALVASSTSGTTVFTANTTNGTWTTCSR